MYRDLGEHLVQQAQMARERAVIVAPFIKYGAISRLVGALGPSVRLQVVTRWTPEEVASGVSDLDVWNVVKSRESSELYLRPRLHAKYYRFDSEVFVGSANVTDRGLGWSTSSNLELIVNGDQESLTEFERELLATSIRVDDDIYKAMKSSVEQLSLATEMRPQRDDPEEVVNLDGWTPQSAQVQRLYECYLGNDDLVISSVFEDGRADVSVLAVPEGLDEDDFKAFVAARLQTLAVVAAIDAAASSAVDRIQGAGILAESGHVRPEEAEAAWDIWSSWLVHFFPTRFRIKSTYRGPALERSRLLR